jgi:nucleoid-associated protein YgaU
MTAIAHPARPTRHQPRATLRLVEPTCTRRRHAPVTAVPGPVARPAATYRRRRALAVAAVVLAVALAIAGVRVGAWVLTAAGGVDGAGAAPAAGTAPAVARAIPIGQRLVVVQPGDTMWSIARRVDPTGDPRATVDRLIEANGTVALQPGQRLVLPEP